MDIRDEYFRAAVTHDQVGRMLEFDDYWPFQSAVKEDDWLTVREEYWSRGGKSGLVLNWDDEGCSLDFFCGRDNDPRSLPSVEFWDWEELQVRLDVPHHPSRINKFLALPAPR